MILGQMYKNKKKRIELPEQFKAKNVKRVCFSHSLQNKLPYYKFAQWLSAVTSVQFSVNRPILKKTGMSAYIHTTLFIYHSEGRGIEVLVCQCACKRSYLLCTYGFEVLRLGLLLLSLLWCCVSFMVRD